MTGLTVALLLLAASTILALSSGRSVPRVSSPTAPAPESGISDPSLILDLVGALLTAGSSVEGALATFAGSCEPALARSVMQVHAARMLGATWDAAWVAGSVDRSSVRGPRGVIPPAAGTAFEELQEGLRFATSTGAPSAALLHAHAAQLRRRHNRDVDRRAAALGVQLVLPLGLCSLPAFICLGVVPVVLGLLPDL